MADETEAQARRGRRITGHVFKRGKAGVFYVRFACKNKEHCIRLVDPKTQQPITNDRAARRLADAIIAPYAARDLLALRQNAAQAVRSAQDTVAEAERLASAAQVRKTPLTAMLDTWPAKDTAPRRLNAPVRALSESTKRQHKEAWSAFCKYMAAAHPGVLFAEDVTPDHATGFAEHVLTVQGFARATLNITVGKLHLLFRRAKLPDPFAAVPRYAVAHEHESKEPLTVDELQNVLSTAGGELRTLLHILAFTGLRLGDACTLSWAEHIQLDVGRIIRRTRKTGKVVSLRLHPVLLSILCETPPAERHGYVVPAMAEAYTRGTHRVSQIVTQHFERCGLVTVKPAGESAAPRARGASLRGAHCLRHTFISLCARAGVPQGAIADWIGHSPEIDALYTHWLPRDTDNAILAALPSLNATKALPSAVEPERAEAHRLVDGGSIEVVRAMLAAGKGGKA